MHSQYVNAPPVRTPVLVRQHLGPAGWATLHRLAALRKRSARHQVIALLHFALARAIAGDDVELSQQQLEELLGSTEDELELTSAVA